MNKEHAEPLLSMYPKAAQYDDKKLILIAEYPEGFDGETVELNKLGFNEGDAVDEDGNDIEGLTPEQLNQIVDTMLAEEPTGKLVIISKAQGRYLYANHPAFKPEVTDEY
jgi:hypothetical protein